METYDKADGNTPYFSLPLNKWMHIWTVPAAPPAMVEYTCTHALWNEVYPQTIPNEQVPCKLNAAGFPTDTQWYDAGTGAFWHNCFCMFDTPCCQFDTYSTGRIMAGLPYILTDMIPGSLSLVNPTDYEGAYFQINQDLPFRKVINITAFTKMGFGVSFRTEIVVCGNEQLICPTCVGQAGFVAINYQSLQNAAPQTYTSATMNSYFSYVFPSVTVEYGWNPPPNGWTQCTVNDVKLCLDCNCNTLLNHPLISLGNVPNSDNHRDVVINRSGPITQTFYYRASTRGQVTECKQFYVEICGFETVTTTLGYTPRFPSTMAYDLNQGGGSVNTNFHDINGVGVTSFWQVNSTFCLVDTYDIVMYDASGVLVASDRAFLSGNLIQVKTDSPTSPFKTTHYIRACTKAGKCALQPFDMYVCGGETVSTSENSNPYYYRLYGDSGGPDVLRNDVQTDFSTSIPQCPIVSYLVEQKTGPTTWITFQLLSPNDPSSKVYVKQSGALRPLIVNTISPPGGPIEMLNSELYVTARTKAGNLARYPFRLKVCGAEGFNTYETKTYWVYDYQTSTRLLETGNFKNSNDPLCPVIAVTFTVFNNATQTCTNTPFPTNTLLTWGVTPGKVFTNTSTPQLTSLCVKFQTITNYVSRQIYSFYTVTIKVCGGETVIKLLGQDPEKIIYHGEPAVEANIDMDVRNWFKSSDIDCPITSYKLFNETYQESDKDLAYMSGTDPISPIRIDVKTVRDFLGKFRVRAMTKSGQYDFQDFKLHFCGYERVKIKGQGYYVYEQNQGPPHSRVFETYKDLVVNTDPVICPIVKEEIMLKTTVNGITTYKPYLDGLIDIPFTNQTFGIWTTNPGRYQVYVKYTTLGDNFNYLPVFFEICGGVMISFNSDKNQILRVYQQNSGLRNIQTIRNILSIVSPASANCPIVWSLTKLYQKNLATGQLEEYTDTRVRLDLIQDQAWVNTTEIYHVFLLVMIKTRSSNPFYIPLDVEVTPFSPGVFNQPPYFGNPQCEKQKFLVNQTKDVYKVCFNLTKQYDDWNNLTFMNVSNSELGKLKTAYTYPGQYTYEFSRIYDILTFDNVTNQLCVSIKGGPREIAKYTGAVYQLKIVLQDHQWARAEKICDLDLQLNETWYEIWLREQDYEDTVKINNPPVGKIKWISVFGEVLVNLNASSNFRAVNLTRQECKNFDHSKLRIYIHDIYDWFNWREHASTSLNFTWELREFNEHTIRIKLNFMDPTAVSPFPRYDQLHIYFGELGGLFYNVKQRRELTHVKNEVLMKKGIQKQMHDTPFGREMVDSMYWVRCFLVGLIAFTLIISLVFSPPFDRVFLMVLEFQIMCNFPIFHITLPGNVEITTQIMKIFTSLNFLKNWDLNFFNSEISEDDAELPLESLGQRHTYHYDSYYLIFNLKTLSWVFFYLLIKLILLGLMYIYKHWSKSKRRRDIAQKYHSILLDHTMFDDLLKIYMFGFLELCISMMVAFSQDRSRVDYTFPNLFLASAVCFLMGYGVPFVYYFIHKRALNRETNILGFKEKFGSNFMGAKIDLITQAKSKSSFHQVYWFYGVRLAFVMLSFVTSHGWLQTIALIYLFLASTCRIASSKPFYGSWHNRLRVYNQFALLGCCYHLMLFTDYVEREEQYIMGFSFLIWIGVFIIINLLYVVLSLIRYLYFMVILYCDWLLHYLKIWWYFLMQCFNRCPAVLAYLKYFFSLLVYYFELLAFYLSMLCCKRPNPQDKQQREIKLEIENVDEIIEQKPSIVRQAEPTPSFPVQKEEPNSRPASPTVKTLKLINGVWTQVFVKVSQMNQVPGGRDYLSSQPFTWKKAIETIKDKSDNLNKDIPMLSSSQSKESSGAPLKYRVQEEEKNNHLFQSNETLEVGSNFQELKVKKKKKKKKSKSKKTMFTPKWGEVSDMIFQTFEEVKEPARFHDPALFFKDQGKYRGQDAMQKYQQVENGKVITKVRELNPLFDDMQDK